ncbi:MAG: HRDC domain-containing protein [Deltaproteobacteria bacterium]|nr:HRDC domain-containing protein [Deltaproteobacteria bacterium]
MANGDGAGPERPFSVMDTGDTRMASVVASLAREPRLALDTESNSFHSYHEKICLIQVSTPTQDYVLDPLRAGLPDTLRSLLSSEDRLLVLHGADFDVRSFKRTFHLKLGLLFDTHVAASLLGRSDLGLKALVHAELGQEISKDEQRSDWSRRPLSERQLEYARQDTRFLLALAERLEEQLVSLGRLDWLKEECERLREVQPSERVFDPEAYMRIKGARTLGARGRRVLRAAYLWREQVADASDVAPFRVLRNDQMIRLGVAADRDALMSSLELTASKWLPRELDRRGLVDALEATAPPMPPAQRTPQDATGRETWEAGSRGPGKPSGRLDEATRLRFERLAAVRNAAAARLGLDPGFFLSNSFLRRVALAPPASLEDLARMEGITRWRCDVVGEELLASVHL